MDLQLEQIEKLMERFEESALSEFSLTSGDVTFCMKKAQPANATGGNQPASAASNAAAQSNDDQTSENAEAADLGTAVKASLVGTFYVASEPGADPYVKEGQVVKKGDVVGLIEAMKIMNEILAPADGVIGFITAEDGMLVSYDQPLMYIREIDHV